MHKQLVSKLLAHQQSKPKKHTFQKLMSESSAVRKGVLLLPSGKRGLVNSAKILEGLEKMMAEGTPSERKMAQAELQKWALVMGPTIKQQVEMRTTSLKANHSKQTTQIIAAKLETARVRPSKRKEIVKLLTQKMDLALEESRSSNSPTRKALFMEDFRAYAKAIEQIKSLK